MTSLTSQVNRLYLNAAEALAQPQAWKLDLYVNDLGGEVSNLIGRLRKANFNWQDTTFAALSTSLNVIKTYSRCLLSADPVDDFWSGEISGLDNEIQAVRNYLPESIFAMLEELRDLLLRNSGPMSQLHSEAVRNAINEVDGRVLLVPETARLRHKADSWVVAQGLVEKVTVHSLRDARVQLLEPFTLTLFPSSPSAYLNRDQFDSHLRALLLTGLTPKSTFVSPDWFFFKRDLQLEKHLLPGFDLTGIPKIEVSSAKREAFTQTDDTPDSDDSFDDWVPRHATGDYAIFEDGGDQPCRVISIGEELVFPVESDSKKVSVFEFNDKADAWQTTFRHPFKELKSGDFLIACVDRSESQALRERAARDMGDDFQRYLETQKNWKSLLASCVIEKGITQVEAELKAAGVDKFGRARNWVEEVNIDPLINRDFEVLLHWLGIGKTQAKLTLDLAKAMDGARSQAGRNTSNAVAQSLDEQELAALEKGQALEITLEDFGGATYLIAPVLGVGDEVILFRSSQVRRVVAGKFEVD